MKKIFLKVKWRWAMLLIFLMVVSFLIKIKPDSVLADSNCPEFKIWVEDNGKNIYAPDPFPDSIQRFTYKISVKDKDNFKEYIVYTGQGDAGEYKSPPFTAVPDPGIGYILQDTVIYNQLWGRNTNESFNIGPHDITVKEYRNGQEGDIYCKSSYSYKSTFITPTPAYTCTLDVDPKDLKPDTPFKILGKTLPNNQGLNRIFIDVYDETSRSITESGVADLVLPTPPTHNFEASFRKKAEGGYQITANLQKQVVERTQIRYVTLNSCSIRITTCAIGCGAPSPTPTPIPSPTNPPICQACQRAFDPCADQRCKESCNFCATPIPSPTNFPPAPPLAPLCEQLPIDFVEKCKKCIDKPEEGGLGGIWTAVGCIPIEPEVFIRDYLFKIGIGIAGGVAFLYFIFGVFQILTSAGNAEKIAAAKEIIMSAISGLLLIIFSILLLKVIGVDILRIPGFS